MSHLLSMLIVLFSLSSHSLISKSSLCVRSAATAIVGSS